MKKMFFSLAVFTAMFLMVGCGGNDIESSRGYGYSECSYGSYKCKGGDSYWCGYADGSNDLIWQLSERCSYSCDDSTGKCSSSSGGGNSGDNSSGDNSGGNSGESSASECSSGQYKCEGNYSFYCYGGSWGYYDDCATAGCNSGTGQCNSGGNSGGGSSNAAYQTCCDLAYCLDACPDQNCYDNCFNNSSSSATSDYEAIFYCGNNYGCGPDSNGYYDVSCLSTYCASQLNNCCYEVDNGGGNSGGSSGGGGNSGGGCQIGTYLCSGKYSFYCADGYAYSIVEECSDGCNSSTGQCNSSSGGGSSGGGDSSSKSPCPPEASASVSGSTVKLRWTYKTSSICGIPTKTTVKWHDPNYGWIEFDSSNASSFTSASLGITGCGYQEDGRWLLLAGILVENDAGGNVAYCRCEIDAKECKCY